jgi:magnesium transporter
MPRLFKKVSKKVGLSPGELVFVGEKKEEKASIQVIDYTEDKFEEKELESVGQCFPFRDTETVTWINIDGLHEVDILKKLGECYGFHPLILEDILSTGQRPKIEDFENYLFIVLRMLYRKIETDDIVSEQISLILTRNAVISFQETKGDVFDSIRDRIRNNKGRIRKMGADYLAYILLDAVVDNYFVVLETLGEKIEIMEEGLINDPEPETLHAIHSMKREIIYMRKSVWPLRDVVSSLERGEPSLIKDTTQVYLRDLYDHTIQVIDTIEAFRDTVSGMLDIYLTSTSNKMNEVMKVLTIIATIFIPLGFMAGLYGMNFDHMPELHWKGGYFMALTVMSLAAGLMLVYFKRKGWF